MEVKELTCIECPVGCRIEVGLENGAAAWVKGNGCPRGKLYAENEVVAPKRVITSTVKRFDGKMIPVKTDKPVKKSEMFAVMAKINAYVCEKKVKIGEVLIENISDGANLVATAEIE